MAGRRETKMYAHAELAAARAVASRQASELAVTEGIAGNARSRNETIERELAELRQRASWAAGLLESHHGLVGHGASGRGFTLNTLAAVLRGERPLPGGGQGGLRR